MDMTKKLEGELTEKSDHVILEKLRAEGYKDLDTQNLFEILYNDDKIREKIMNDMKNIIETARDYNIHLPISNKIKKLYAMIVKQGKSNLDHSALYLLLKRFKKY